MLVHQLQMILNFFYVCKYVCFLTSLPKLDKEISPVLDEISFWFFLRHSWDVATLLLNYSEFLVCLLVCQLAYFLTEIRQIQGYLKFWMRYLSEIFQGHSLDVGTLFPNDSKILICLSVCQLAKFPTEIRQMLGYLQFWMRYLSEIFWRHSWDAGTLFPNNSEFLVCLSVRLFAYFRTEIRQM